MTAVYVQIAETRGSTPRDKGTAMKVTYDSTTGTIGGGALEFEAIRIARKMLTEGSDDHHQNFPLGPNLGQCCGGSVKLLFTRTQKATDMHGFSVHEIHPNRPHPCFLWVWGAGHVGRAVMQACPPQAFKTTWVDDHADRFPIAPVYQDSRVVAADMPLLASRAPTYAHHLVFTYSHEIDFGLCAALLRRGAASIGLIGSDTKWARFSKRLGALGLDPSAITCPIGDKSLGKRPDAIACGTVKSLLAQINRKQTA